MSQFWNFLKESPGTVALSITGRIGVDMERRETFKNPGAEIDRFIADIDAHAHVKQLNIKINSSGGHADIGLAIYMKLREHTAFKQMTIEGGACSAAALIAMAGDHRLIAEDAYFNIHEVHQAVFGRAAMLRAIADHIEELTKTMVSIFSTRSGLSENVVAELLRNDTVLTAKQALEKGFVHEIIPARHVPLNTYQINRITSGCRFVNDCLTCKSPCERCLAGELE